MMTTAPVSELMADLERAGIELQADGDRLRFRPQSAIPPDLAARLKANKAGILAMLKKADTPDIPPRPQPWQGHYMRLTFKDGWWAWRQQKIDAAHRAWLDYHKAGKCYLT